MNIVPFETSEQQERIVRLKMLQSNKGSVRIAVCDEGGRIIEKGYLLEISPSGVYFEPYINQTIGFSLSAFGELKRVTK